MSRSKWERLRSVADNLERFWGPMAKDGDAEITKLAHEDAQTLREIADMMEKADA